MTMRTCALRLTKHRIARPACLPAFRLESRRVNARLSSGNSVAGIALGRTDVMQNAFNSCILCPGGGGPGPRMVRAYALKGAKISVGSTMGLIWITGIRSAMAYIVGRI